MIKKFLFGQYIYKNSVIHRLDTRIKILHVLFLSIFIFYIDNITEILIFSFFIILIVLLSKLEIKTLNNNLRPFYIIFVFIIMMYVIFSRSQLEQGFVVAWRFLMLMITSIILTFSTTISSMISAIEKLLKPLKIIKLKPRNTAVMISIAIRFVPVMFLNFNKLKESMLARLANFNKLNHIKILILTLLEKMLKSASTLSDAMQSRLYNENAESYNILRIKKIDYASIIFTSIFMLLILVY